MGCSIDKGRPELKSQTEPSRVIYIRGKSSHEDIRTDRSKGRNKTWLGIIVIVLFASCFVGLEVSKRKSVPTERLPPVQARVLALTRQLSSLTQTDLITFPDGRVWYVRSVHGKNLEVIGWVGDNTRIEDIDEFALREDSIEIVRHNDSAYPLEPDKFLNQ
jgi:hypothetical protein